MPPNREVRVVRAADNDRMQGPTGRAGGIESRASELDPFKVLPPGRFLQDGKAVTGLSQVSGYRFPKARRDKRGAEGIESGDADIRIVSGADER